MANGSVVTSVGLIAGILAVLSGKYFEDGWSFKLKKTVAATENPTPEAEAEQPTENIGGIQHQKVGVFAQATGAILGGFGISAGGDEYNNGNLPRNPTKSSIDLGL
jgi:hypothetical protein